MKKHHGLWTGLLFSFLAVSMITASEGTESPPFPGQVIPDLGFEPVVDIADTQLEPPLAEDSVDDPSELQYLTPEPDVSGDDMAPAAGSGGSSDGSKQ